MHKKIEKLVKYMMTLAYVKVGPKLKRRNINHMKLIQKLDELELIGYNAAERIKKERYFENN